MCLRIVHALFLAFISFCARAQDAENANAHFQSTYVWQVKPALGSPYEGANSLKAAREKSYSFTATAAFGLRLSPGTEFYVNPEAAQGVPLSNLTGLSALTNSELAKTSGPRITAYPARLFVRQVIGLGGETKYIPSAANQLASNYDARRVVITAGVFSALDLFDANRYAKDPRTQFINWALMTHGAYDYPADSRGYTRGIAAEYFANGWAVRAARLTVPRQPNQLKLDPRLFRRFGDQVEVARDVEVYGRPGSVRALAFRVRAQMASYDAALTASPAGAPPTLDSARDRVRTKTGVGVAMDQELSDGVGVFARLMRADGRTETYAFTESDGSASAGVSFDGKRWGRAGDTLGIAAAIGSLSRSHREFLARGGQTFFLGDGALRYGPETVAEIYYSLQLARDVRLSLDFQRVFNPGFNKDRGPAAFYAARLHWEH